jgi:predicted dehydrogenase
MVGHLLRYHPTVERLLALARSGALGRLLGVEATRLSTAGLCHDGVPCRGPFSHREPSALWLLGPHDLSVLHALDPSPVHTLSARSGPGGDPVVVTAELGSGLAFSATFARAAAAKERTIRVIGTAAAAVFDDVRAPDRLLVGGAEITVPWREPLAVEIEHFLGCVETRARPRTPLDDGVTVVRALALAEERHGAAAVAGI